jgi:hypothetical protein
MAVLKESTIMATQIGRIVSWALLIVVMGASMGWAQSPAQLEKRIKVLEAKLKFLVTYLDAAGRPTVEIRGANLRVVNGAGATARVNGLGNLIVGYNELRQGGQPNYRDGSHNLMVGEQHNYVSYGGFPAGVFNEITGPYASICGGVWNFSDGHASAVLGGILNHADGDEAAVGGGQDNHADGLRSVVSGGVSNTASGTQSTVGGGYQRQTAEQFNWAAGEFASNH